MFGRECNDFDFASLRMVHVATLAALAKLSALAAVSATLRFENFHASVSGSTRIENASTVDLFSG